MPVFIGGREQATLNYKHEINENVYFLLTLEEVGFEPTTKNIQKTYHSNEKFLNHM